MSHTCAMPRNPRPGDTYVCAHGQSWWPFWVLCDCCQAWAGRLRAPKAHGEWRWISAGQPADQTGYNLQIEPT